jgi:L-aminopeptidase/D-esterase-like protein
MTITAVPGIHVGHATVPGGGSGCTVILGPFRGAVELLGMATGTRELGVLSPHHLAGRVDAVLLTGGSAFGLAAADGVVSWLASKGRGFQTPVSPVPLVPAAVIYDLDPGVKRPGPDQGYEASEAAASDPVKEGLVGAGSGATVGKLLGPTSASQGGIGSSSRAWKNGTVGALAVVNALGDIVGADGTVLAGPRDSEGAFLRSDEIAKGKGPSDPPFPGTNTTLVVLATDLPLSRVDLGRVAKMASSAFPRAISPVFSPFDGDLVFALSTSDSEEPFPAEDLLSLGVLAREVVEESIRSVAVARGGQKG